MNVITWMGFNVAMQSHKTKLELIIITGLHNVVEDKCCLNIAKYIDDCLQSNHVSFNH